MDHREAQGLRVVMANLTDVADEFAGGNVDDVAIRDFVRHAYESWQPPAVANLLLVGEPNLDVLNYLDKSPHYHLMPMHFGVTAVQGETMTDTWFGAVAGVDLLPDVGVARFSARTTGQAADLVAKVIGYETQPPAGAAWGENVIQIAANESAFENSLEDAAAFLPGHFTVTEEYRSAGANDNSIIDAFDDGAVVTSFVGHGNVTLWADAGSSFFNTGDADDISNAGKLPLVTALNCLNGFIGHPVTLDSLAETFHNQGTEGALAMWSPSSLGFLGEYDALQEELYRTIFASHQPVIGTATTLALVQTWLTQPVSIDLVTEMVLLGDPSGWLAIDSDDDLLLDQQERMLGLDPGDRDTDDDGLLDGLETNAGEDADLDGLPNGLDPDADNDGLPDGLEAGVAVPDPDTDVSRGFFRADLEPATTTDPLDPDTDAGGAPDGAEDLSADGLVDVGETDPLAGGDDPVCAASAPPEIAALPSDELTVEIAGNDLVLSWGDASASDPCVLYYVYAADDLDNGTGSAGYGLLGVTAVPSLTHLGAIGLEADNRYLVVGHSLAFGPGPWGHYGQ